MPRRVLVTDAEDFVGPAVVERFRAGGDDVVAVTEPFDARVDVADTMATYGPFDVVVANLSAPVTVMPIGGHDDALVDGLLNRLVYPLFWIVGECVPPMVEHRAGSIVVPTSALMDADVARPAAGLHAARAAQTALVQAVGDEIAEHGVRVNGVAVPATPGREPAAAEVVWWLASTAASHVAGTVVTVDDAPTS